MQAWKRGAVAAIPKDALERISYILGIYKGLHILLPKTADEWVRKPNMAALFGGGSALQRLVSSCAHRRGTQQGNHDDKGTQQKIHAPTNTVG